MDDHTRLPTDVANINPKTRIRIKDEGINEVVGAVVKAASGVRSKI